MNDVVRHDDDGSVKAPRLKKRGNKDQSGSTATVSYVEAVISVKLILEFSERVVKRFP